MARTQPRLHLAVPLALLFLLIHVVMSWGVMTSCHAQPIPHSSSSSSKRYRQMDVEPEEGDGEGEGEVDGDEDLGSFQDASSGGRGGGGGGGAGSFGGSFAARRRGGGLAAPVVREEASGTFEHRFGSSGEFAPAGGFTVDYSTKVSSLGESQVVVNRLMIDTPGLSATKQEWLRNNEFYSIRFPSRLIGSSPSSSPSWPKLIASAKARCVAAANFSLQLRLHVDELGNAVAASLYPLPLSSSSAIAAAATSDALTGCVASAVDDEPADELHVPSTLTLSAVIVRPQVSPGPMLVAPIMNPGQQQPAGEEGPKQPQQPKTFWQKYWMFLLPVFLGVLNVVGSIIHPMEGEWGATGGRGGDGGGAPAAAAGSGRGPAQQRRR